MKIKWWIFHVFCLGLIQRLLDGAGNGLLDIHSLLAGDLIFKHFYILWSLMEKDLGLGTGGLLCAKFMLPSNLYFLSLIPLLPSSYPLRTSVFLPQPGQLFHFSPWNLIFVLFLPVRMTRCDCSASISQLCSVRSPKEITNPQMSSLCERGAEEAMSWRGFRARNAVGSAGPVTALWSFFMSSCLRKDLSSIACSSTAPLLSTALGQGSAFPHPQFQHPLGLLQWLLRELSKPGTALQQGIYTDCLYYTHTHSKDGKLMKLRKMRTFHLSCSRTILNSLAWVIYLVLLLGKSKTASDWN